MGVPPVIDGDDATVFSRAIFASFNASWKVRLRSFTPAKAAAIARPTRAARAGRVTQSTLEPLPLNQPVEITFTPTKAGKFRYACGMDMITGVIIVE